MTKYNISKGDLQRKPGETDREYGKRMYEAACKLYDYIGF